MLNKSCESRHPCFVPDLRENALRVVSSPFFVNALYVRLRQFSSIPRLLRFPYIHDEYRQLPFLCLSRWYYGFSFQFIDTVNFIGFSNIDPTLRSWDKPYLSRYPVRLIDYWSPDTSLRNSASVSLRDIGLQFSYYMFLWFRYQDDSGLVEWVRRFFPSLFWNSLCGIGIFFINAWSDSLVKPFRVEILCVCMYGWVGRFVTTNLSFNRFRLSVSYWVAFINCVFLEIRLLYVSCLKLFTVYPCCYPFNVYRICTDVPSFILDIGGLCLLFFLDHSG